MAFKPALSQINIPEIEDRIISYWKENKIFEKSVESRPADKQWNFLDGPPFITGLPHYGTLLSSIPKDVFPRYWTMKGYRVRRVWGWDCHGLPAENKVEKKLGLKRKRDIEERVGVKKFIDECKLYVNEVSGEWEWYVDHIGRWVDFKNAYKTMDTSYMETVMWVFKQMYDKGHIYKGARVSLYCPHCSTPISNFEVAMDPDNYKDVTEPSNTYKYKLTDEDVFLLAWSTTPWNKIATPALAVNPELDYVQVEQNNEHYILAKNTLKLLKPEPSYKIEKEFKGSELVGRTFEPHYNFYKIDEGKKAFVIIPGEFVTEDEGTGIVTIAAYGEEDMIAMQKNNIQIVLHVDDEGKMKSEVPNWAGMYYLDVNPLVNADLESRGLMYREDSHTHSVAHCWRCGTRLIFAPQDAWYVNVQDLKGQLEQTNEDVNWFPEHFKKGRFLKSLQAAPDWCISRSRYWGSPVPVWECECGQRYVPGSIAELEEMSGQKINDLHKPEIDEVVIKCTACGKDAHRVPEVLDSWIEAGSAAFAERHFPFSDEKKELFFPPDFIVEYTGQIRAWFYVLHVISNALFGEKSFKNVLVTGVVLGTDGRKMSKNFGNYPDPKEMLSKYGGDALRLYLLGSPVLKGEDIIISEKDYSNRVRGILLIYWNVYSFFVTNAIADNWTPSNKLPDAKNTLDQWILSRLKGNIENMASRGFEKYDTPEIVGQIETFMNDLSGWYVRRIRDRIGPSVEESKDKKQAYETLFYVLKEYTKAMAPTIPFMTEEVYTNLTGEESVHLADWPVLPESWSNPTLEENMESGRKIASAILAHRKEANIKVRTPLIKMQYSGPQAISDEVKQIVLQETNVYELDYDDVGDKNNYSVSGDVSLENQDVEGGKARDLIRQIQALRKEKGALISQNISLTVPEMPQEKYLQDIKRKVLAKDVKLGNGLAIELL